MHAPRIERTLRIGIALSLGLHLTFASFVHPLGVEADEPEPPTRAIIIHVAPPTPPPPTPTPPPPRTPPSVHRPRTAAQLLRPALKLVHLKTANGPAAQAPIAPRTSQAPAPEQTSGTSGIATQQPPQLAPTPKPACSAPDVPAKAIDPVTPEEPPFARDEGLTGMAKIRVDLDATGSVVGASVYASTGSAQLDQAALQAATQTRYAPEKTDCKDVPGSYLFTVQFES
ncbi:MAG TPA: TonB family protein [Candidatus Baltobacteraceae bacterium]|nr:TonB family protein [Candidatus Baltobacteraceae bacterium]